MPSVPTCARRVLRSEETAQVSVTEIVVPLRSPRSSAWTITANLAVIADEYGSSPQSDL
jgi:hypothetical protein